MRQIPPVSEANSNVPKCRQNKYQTTHDSARKLVTECECSQMSSNMISSVFLNDVEERVKKNLQIWNESELPH